MTDFFHRYVLHNIGLKLLSLALAVGLWLAVARSGAGRAKAPRDRKSTRLNSSHGYISYAVFCLKKKKKKQNGTTTIKHRTHHPSILRLRHNSTPIQSTSPLRYSRNNLLSLSPRPLTRDYTT